MINTVQVNGQEKYLIVSRGEEGIAAVSGSQQGRAVSPPILLQCHPVTPGLGCGSSHAGTVCVLV